jgi:hypothetical protein
MNFGFASLTVVTQRTRRRRERKGVEKVFISRWKDERINLFLQPHLSGYGEIGPIAQLVRAPDS